MALIIEDIRREINHTIRMGYHVNNIEAFLIHCDDAYTLLKDDHDYCQKYGFPCSIFHTENNEMKICGIKIITSEYVERGTIHKIFKNNLPYIPPQFQTYLPENEPINFPEYLRLPTIVDKKKKKKKHSTTRKIELGD
jgi:hypothetical protein